MNNTTYIEVQNGSQKELIINVDGGRGGTITVQGWNPGAFGVEVNESFKFAEPVTESSASITSAERLAAYENSLQQISSTGHTPFPLLVGVGWSAEDFAKNNRMGAIDVSSGLYGGLGSDALYGGNANDWLFGNHGYEKDTSVYAGMSYGRYLAPNSIYVSDADLQRFERRASVNDYHRFMDFVNGLQAEDHNSGDLLDGGAGHDVISAAEGNDTAFGDEGDDRLYGGDGADMLLGGNHNDIVLGDSNASVAFGYRSTLVDTAESGVNYDDVIDGGAGDDFLAGEIGNDVIEGGAGNDVIFGDRWAQASDVGLNYYGSYGYAGQYLHYGSFTASWYSAVYSDAPKESWHFNVLPEALHGDDVLSGGAVADELYGNGGNDTLIGGTGDDWLEGGAGDDLYVFAEGDSLLSNGFYDRINDTEGTNHIQFTGIAAASMVVSESGNGFLQIEYGSGKNAVTLDTAPLLVIILMGGVAMTVFSQVMKTIRF